MTTRIAVLVVVPLIAGAAAHARGTPPKTAAIERAEIGALQADRANALTLTAQRLLMLPGDRTDGAPPQPIRRRGPSSTDAKGTVPDWASTVGGVGLEPAAVLQRLFGVGHARVNGAPGGKLDVHWLNGKRDQLIGRVDLGTAERAPHFEPTRQTLRRRNALVGRALLAEIVRLQAEGKLSVARVRQPETWRSPAPTAFTSRGLNIQHSLASRMGDRDPLAAALSPVPETHFLFPEHVPYSSERGRALRAEWQRWAATVDRWIDPRLRPVDGPGEPAARGRRAHANVRAAQREGWVRPISIGWRDRDGAHHLELRQVGGRKMAVHRFVPRRLLARPKRRR